MKIEQGQTAVVTGSASGIGLALAEACTRRGVNVVLSDIQEGPLEKAEAHLRAQGAEVLAVPADVSDPAQVDALAAAALDRFGRLDLVCNNAGVVGPQAPSWEQDVATWNWLLNVAFLGVVHGIRSFVPHFVAQGRGHVLNTASVGGLITLPGLAPYNAAKHAVVGLSETLREELRGTGVGVSVLCPGMVPTALARTSAANRPDGVRSAAESPTSAGEAPARHGTVLGADAVAQLALDGVEAERLHIITHADSEKPVLTRIQSVLDDLTSRS